MSAWNTLDDSDVVIVFVDSVKTIDVTVKDMITNLEKYMKKRNEDRELEPLKAFLFLNKYDKYMEDDFRTKKKFPVADRFRLHFENLDVIFDQVLYGSALNGEGLDELKVF